MIKALLAASAAMIVCCAAAAWAGPVQPADDALAVPGEGVVRDPHPFDVIAFPSPSPADFVLSDDFAPASLSATYGTSAPSTILAPEDASAVAPPAHAQPAVIPLPTPLYAAVALLAMALITRRLMLHRA